ncbi:phosphotransferase [Kribbella yunnanensis]|uniref:Phosphotransferase n=1 Tax=Kribbella yunnanensis TaxID=190194 RepID=A0ABN2GXC1_9ACTN
MLSPTLISSTFDLDINRIEPTRAGDDSSPGNGNWHVWTSAGDHHILRRHHVLHTGDSLAYETKVLDHLTDRGWCVPQRIAGPIQYDGRLWSVTRFVPGGPHSAETADQRTERGSVLARLHDELRGLDLGTRPTFYEACDLGGMGSFQGWDAGLAAMQSVRPDLADRSEELMDRAKRLVVEHKLRELPKTIVHGDFAEWNLHFTADGKLGGVIDFDLCHPDSRAWEFTIARVYRSPELVTGYQRTSALPLSDSELAAFGPLQVVLRALSVMAALWDGRQRGSFDEVYLERQLTLGQVLT